MSELHFVRIREKDSKDPFLDPVADIKEVMRRAFVELPVVMSKGTFSEGKAERLRQILKVFVTRLEEDRAPLEAQIRAFQDAISISFTPAEQAMFWMCLAYYNLASFALHMRRDSKVDATQRYKFNQHSALLELFELMQPSGIEMLKDSMKVKLEELNKEFGAISHAAVNAVCVEDDKDTLENIKDRAAALFSADVGSTWETIAKACDEFVEADLGSDDALLAAALAYPDYNTPYYEATKDE